jgi:hypothetical protein
MDQLREKEIFLDDDLMCLLLDSRDQISQLVAHALDNAEVPIGDSLRETGEELLKNLYQYLDINTPNPSETFTDEGGASSTNGV